MGKPSTTESNKKGQLTMFAHKTKSLYCPSCGAYLGEAVPGYLKTAQCFCGELVEIAAPREAECTDLVPGLAAA